MGDDDNRRLMADMKLYGQTFMAHSYCRTFMDQAAATAIGELLSHIRPVWKPGARLTDEQANQLTEANETLRGVYETSPGRGNNRTSFDEQFSPAVGWSEYFSRNLR